MSIKFFVFLIGLLGVIPLMADNFLNFASQDSAITCADGVQFNVDKDSSLSINGTLWFAGDPAASLSGVPVNFAQGYLRTADGREVLLNAVLDPKNDMCLLQSGVLFAQDGITFKNIAVKGPGNMIAGVLHITGSILVTRGADLTIDIPNDLEGDIVLNGGKLVLASDLVLTAGTKIIGPGVVDLQNHKLYVQPGDDIAWVANVTFKNGGVDILGSGAGGGNLPPSLFNAAVQSNGKNIVLSAGQYRVVNSQPIVVSKNMTLDGGSSTITLMTSTMPVGRTRSKGSTGDAHIRVAAGKTLTLSNMVLSNITAKTFDLGVGAVLAFGENVTLEFGGDAFLSDGLFKVLNTSSGGANVVRMRGMNGRKLFILSAMNINQKALLDLNGNSVVMQDLELIGAGFIVGGNGTGSLALAGNAVLNVESSTDLNIRPLLKVIL